MRSSRPLFRLSIHQQYVPSTSIRLSSTASTPSLLTVRDIPAAHLGHIRILALNNPKSRNAISRQLLTELGREINGVKEQIEDEAARGEVVGEGTRVLILASEVDGAFCAGADLKERKAMSKDEYVHVVLSGTCLLSIPDRSIRLTLSYLLQNQRFPHHPPLNPPHALRSPCPNHKRSLLHSARRWTRTSSRHRSPHLRFLSHCRPPRDKTGHYTRRRRHISLAKGASLQFSFSTAVPVLIRSVEEAE